MSFSSISLDDNFFKGYNSLYIGNEDLTFINSVDGTFREETVFSGTLDESQKINHEKPKISENQEKKIIFNSKIGKRGKPSNNSRIKMHTNLNFDNLQTKIQVHFFSFIINICNDALYSELHDKKNSFKEISYKIKQKVDQEFFELLKESPIRKIVELRISKKYKRCGEDYNQQLLSKVYNKSPWLNKFFNINYIKLFTYYFNYNKEKQNNKINIEGKNITLSTKTKTFCDLLKKKENKKIEKELKETALSVYLNDFDFVIH